MRQRSWFVAWIVTSGCVTASTASPSDAGFVDAPAPDVAAAVVDRPLPADVALDVVDVPLDIVAPPRTVLRVHYPAHGHALAVRGAAASQGLDWNHGVALRDVGGDTWEWSSATVAEAFEWKPLLDDAQWSIGPNYRVAPGTVAEVAPRFVTHRGTWSRAIPSFTSTLLGNARGVWIYLPPTYAENPWPTFPVVWMHDGQNLFDPAASFGGVAWNVQDAMDAGAEDGSIREAVVVGVENTASRLDEYTATRDATEMAGGRADLYVRMLVEELAPVIARSYRVRTGPAETAVLGSSLGGLVSLHAGITHPAVFGAVGAMSPSTWWDDLAVLREVGGIPSAPTRPLRFYVDSGDTGPSNDDVTETAMLAAALRTAGYADGSTLRYVVAHGASHSETWWAQRLPGALAFLLGPRDP